MRNEKGSSVITGIADSDAPSFTVLVLISQWDMYIFSSVLIIF